MLVYYFNASNENRKSCECIFSIDDRKYIVECINKVLGIQQEIKCGDKIYFVLLNHLELNTEIDRPSLDGILARSIVFDIGNAVLPNKELSFKITTF